MATTVIRRKALYGSSLMVHAAYLGQTFAPGLCIWEKGWHQVTEYLLPGGILNLLYDPTIKYNFIPALRGMTNHLPESGRQRGSCV